MKIIHQPRENEAAKMTHRCEQKKRNQNKKQTLSKLKKHLEKHALWN